MLSRRVHVERTIFHSLALNPLLSGCLSATRAGAARRSCGWFSPPHSKRMSRAVVLLFFFCRRSSSLSRAFSLVVVSCGMGPRQRASRPVVAQPRRPSAASRTIREEGPVSYTFVYWAVLQSILCSRDQYWEERPHLSKLFAPTKHKTIPQPLATSRNPSRPLSQTLRILSWPLSQPLATSRDLSRRKHRTFGRRTLPKRAALCTSFTSHLITSHTTPPTDEARATSRNPFATSHTTSCNLACPSLPPSKTLLWPLATS